MLKKPFFAIIFLLLLLWIGGFGIFILDILISRPAQPDKKTEAIIVLTGGHNRIETGLSLWEKSLSQNLFITGVHDSVTKEEIIAMWTRDTILPACCLTLGHNATTTIENALETRAWIKEQNIKTIRLVTSAYHMRRALLEFNHAIKNVEIIPHTVREKEEVWRTQYFWQVLFGEYNKILLRTIITVIQEKL